MLIKKYLREKIAQVVDLPEFSVEVPTKPEYGDYATNAAFLLGKQTKQNPAALADSLSKTLTTDDFSATAIGPFINFRFTDQFFWNQLLHITPAYGQSDSGRGQKVILEFVSANPTGPLHIGHGRWAVLGDVMARLLKTSGCEVATEFYINDAGNQITNLRKSVEAVKNGQSIPEDGYHGAYVRALAESDQDPVESLLAEQQATLTRLGVHFDTWFRETTLHASGEVPKVKEYLDTYEQDGAVWFRSTAYGDDKDRVLIRASGESTYFAADIAYHHHKLQRGYNHLINIWGADHHGYVARMQNALKTELERHQAKLNILIGQLVSLFRNKEPVKMSKRTGEMITLEEVMDEIGVDATRYFMVRRSADTPLEFDLELAKKETSDNPVFYVQYAHARICSILRNALTKDAVDEKEPIILSGSVRPPLFNEYERALAKKLCEFPDEVETAALSYQPHRMTLYAEALSAVFHVFYHHCRVLTDDPETSAKRIQLVKATQQVLHIILEILLGITAPEKM